MVKIKILGCWVILLILEQNAQYSLEGKNKVNKIKGWFLFEVRGREQKGQSTGVEGWRGCADWRAK